MMSWRYRGAQDRAGGKTERQVNYETYKRMVKDGVPISNIITRFGHYALEQINDDLMKEYWNHVRGLLVRVPMMNNGLVSMGLTQSAPLIV